MNGPRPLLSLLYGARRVCERRYLRAMSELGPGPHRSGDVAETLDQQVPSLAPTRSNLIRKGMVWSPAHGDTAVPVPLFDEFMRRVMPGQDLAGIAAHVRL